MWILSLSTLQKSAALKATGAAVSRDQRKGNGGSHAVRNSNASRPVRETPGHKKNDDFRDQYAHAREEQADKLFREIIEIADDASGDYVTTRDGKRSSITRTSNARVFGSMPGSGRQPDSPRRSTATA